jgi:hypothetical protein
VQYNLEIHKKGKIDKGYGSIAIGKILEKYDLCGVS